VWQITGDDAQRLRQLQDLIRGIACWQTDVLLGIHAPVLRPPTAVGRSFRALPAPQLALRHIVSGRA